MLFGCFVHSVSKGEKRRILLVAASWVLLADHNLDIHRKRMQVVLTLDFNL